jgi:hypothetical protein
MAGHLINPFQKIAFKENKLYPTQRNNEKQETIA